MIVLFSFIIILIIFNKIHTLSRLLILHRVVGGQESIPGNLRPNVRYNGWGAKHTLWGF